MHNMCNIALKMEDTMDQEGTITCKVGNFEVSMLREVGRPGSTEILPDATDAILQRYIPESGFTSVINAFLIKMPDMNILVDTGFGGDSFTRMQSLGVAIGDVDVVLITHMHDDHIGGLAKDGKAVFPRAKVYIPEKDLHHFTKTLARDSSIAAVAPYGSRMETFNPEPLNGGSPYELLPGITPIAAYGHTPGHTALRIESEGERFFIIGDLVHVPAVQFPLPEMFVVYDVDRAAAISIRRELLSYAAQEKMPIGGVHLDGIGTVQAAGNGFTFSPVR